MLTRRAPARAGCRRRAPPSARGAGSSRRAGDGRASLFARGALLRVRAGPYMYLFRLDGFDVVGSSPEALVKVEDGRAML
ncbi:hypothetical protein ABZ700_26290, partial [Streptomyces diastaticus]